MYLRATKHAAQLFFPHLHASTSVEILIRSLATPTHAWEARRVANELTFLRLATTIKPPLYLYES